MRWMALVWCVNSYAESVDEPISGFAVQLFYSGDEGSLNFQPAS